MTDQSDTVVEHLRSHAGEALQSVIVYDETSHRDIYRRDDLEALHDSALEAEVLRDVRGEYSGRASAESDLYEGDLRGTVRVFDERVILHLPRDPTSGTVITLDPSVATNLVGFIRDIRSDIYDEGGQ